MTDSVYDRPWPGGASVLLVDQQGRVLLQHRDAGAPTSPLKWSTTGGHIEPGETPAQAARRELWEETTLTAGDDLALFAHVLLLKAPDGSFSFVNAADAPRTGFDIWAERFCFYGATTAQPEDLPEHPPEGDALAFFTPQQALALDLGVSANYFLPLFFASPEYKRLRAGK